MNLDRLSLPVRLAVLAMLVVALAVSAALYAAWRTTDARLTAQIDTDLNTQQREWDRLATANPPRDTASLLATAGAWVREQQDHPARQLQAVAVTGGETRANSAWRSLANDADVTPLLQAGGPRDVRLADGSDVRVLTWPVPAPAEPGRSHAPLGVVVVADPTDPLTAARHQLARDSVLIAGAAMGLAALLVGGGSVLITRQLRRLGHVAAAAGAGDLAVRAGDVRGAPEVRDLARVLDESLDRIAATLDSQRAFVADASHELRTPLAVIRAQAELIGLQTDPALREEDLADLLRQTDATRRLVDDLLTIATGDAAPAALVAPRDIDLRDHVQDLRRDLPLLGERRFEVRTVPGTLRADPDRVDQIVRNLVANAVAHTPRDGFVQVRFEAADIPGRLRIMVRDNGTGMPPEVAAQAFERFARGRPRREPEPRVGISGTAGARAIGSKPTGSETAGLESPGPGVAVGGSAGLGLPLVRTLAQAHGGTATLRSALGEGTTVVVELPGYRASGPGGEAADESAPALTGEAPGAAATTPGDRT